MNRPRRSAFSWLCLRLSCGLIATFAVAGCEEFGALNLSNSAETTTNPATPQTSNATEKDVESPEVFFAQEAGLWDGRPSLGGVWVAHPDVTTPERVIIRNKDNGQFVVGALFRKISDIPGPRFQLSSDAAQAISVLAGAPVNLEVTALRTKEVEVAPVPEPEAVETASPDTPTPEEADNTDQADATAAAATAAAAAAILEQTQAPQDPTVEAEPVMSPAQSAAIVGLDGRLRAAAAAINAPESMPDAVVSDGLVAATATAIATEPVVRSELPATPVDRPFLQVATFSAEENAKRAVSDLNKSGLIASIVEEKSADKSLWRVLVGPATSQEERDALLVQLKTQGFDDAFAVSK